MTPQQAQQSMSPQQALSILDQAVSSLRVTRADHAALVQALQVLQQLTMPPPPTPIKKEK